MAAVGKALHALEAQAADDIRAKGAGGKPLTIEHRPSEVPS
jgi:hypothetical protein